MKTVKYLNNVMAKPKNMINPVEMCCWVHVMTDHSSAAFTRARNIMKREAMNK